MVVSVGRRSGSVALWDWRGVMMTTMMTMMRLVAADECGCVVERPV